MTYIAIAEISSKTDQEVQYNNYSPGSPNYWSFYAPFTGNVYTSSDTAKSNNDVIINNGSIQRGDIYKADDGTLYVSAWGSNVGVPTQEDGNWVIVNV